MFVSRYETEAAGPEVQSAGEFHAAPEVESQAGEELVDNFDRQEFVTNIRNHNIIAAQRRRSSRPGSVPKARPLVQVAEPNIPTPSPRHPLAAALGRGRIARHRV